ncbi:MAG: hypothetical protein HYV07_00090 [Deltaproteobacteria bacterium]|nr:hypothetical protein [Deltaproteobacteria bacterium]
MAVVASRDLREEQAGTLGRQRLDFEYELPVHRTQPTAELLQSRGDTLL